LRISTPIAKTLRNGVGDRSRIAYSLNITERGDYGNRGADRKRVRSHAGARLMEEFVQMTTDGIGGDATGPNMTWQTR